MDEKRSKQVVYVEVDEEIASIIDRVKNIRKDDIYLVVPRKSVLFQSGVNLRILKSKMDHRGRRLLIVTSDRNGAHLAEKVGITVVSRIEVAEAQAPTEENPQALMRPIQAFRNEMQKEESPQRVTEKKLSIRELIQEFRMRDRSLRKAKGKGYVSPLGRPGKKALTVVLTVSVLLFLVIGYIAFPSATVYIRPKFEPLDYTVNIQLADKRLNQSLLQQNKPHVVTSEIVSTTTKQTKVFTTGSVVFQGENAKGFIRILNTENEPWELREGTRFQTADGINFRISKGVEVPGRTLDDAGAVEPGTMKVPVEADPLDSFGKPVGDRGNIPPSRFVIPALSKYNQRLIWGESDAAMTGGVTSYIPVVKKEDIEAAKRQIQDNLIQMAKEDLRTYIDEINRLNKTRMVLMDNDQYLKTKLLDLRYPDGLEGSNREKFELFAKIEASGVAFDYDQLFAILKKEIAGRTHPDMRLREDSLAPQNISYEVLEDNPALGQMKITATLKGIEEYAIEPTTAAGMRFSQKVRENVVGLSVGDASNLVGNMPEVDAVLIKPWPVWLSSLPRIPESIDVKLMEGNP